MGGSASKSKPHSEAENVQSSVLESSSGFHLMEVHFPTLGAGLGLVVLGAVMLHLCLRKRIQRRARHSAPTAPLGLSHEMPFTFNRLLAAAPDMEGPWHDPYRYRPPVPAKNIPRITALEEEELQEANTSKKSKK